MEPERRRFHLVFEPARMLDRSTYTPSLEMHFTAKSQKALVEPLRTYVRGA